MRDVSNAGVAVSHAAISRLLGITREVDSACNTGMVKFKDKV